MRSTTVTTIITEVNFTEETKRERRRIPPTLTRRTLSNSISMNSSLLLLVFVNILYTLCSCSATTIATVTNTVNEQHDSNSKRNTHSIRTKKRSLATTKSSSTQASKTNPLFSAATSKSKVKSTTTTTTKAVAPKSTVKKTPPAGTRNDKVPPTRKINDFPVRINCGSDMSWIDPNTKMEWLADTDYEDSKQSSIVSDCAKKPNPFVPKDELYCNYRLGEIINYSIRVLEITARYKITLYFQEPSFAGTYKRPIDIWINDKVIKQSFDIVNYIGSKNKPTSFTIISDKITTNNNSTIDIKLKAASGKYFTGQKVLISGIVVERTL